MKRLNLSSLDTSFVLTFVVFSRISFVFTSFMLKYHFFCVIFSSLIEKRYRIIPTCTVHAIDGCKCRTTKILLECRIFKETFIHFLIHFLIHSISIIFWRIFFFTHAKILFSRNCEQNLVRRSGTNFIRYFEISRICEKFRASAPKHSIQQFIQVISNWRLLP